MIGFIPRQLVRLSQLEVLSLRENFLQGPIPDLDGLPRLEELYLFGNRLSGDVPRMSNQTALRVCALSCPDRTCADGDDNCFNCPLNALHGACLFTTRCGDCAALPIALPTEPRVLEPAPPSSWLAPVLLFLGPLLAALCLLGLAWYKQRDFWKRDALARQGG